VVQVPAQPFTVVLTVTPASNVTANRHDLGGGQCRRGERVGQSRKVEGRDGPGFWGVCSRLCSLAMSEPGTLLLLRFLAREEVRE
jgi:hypothetical protein